ncbi:uncharacterized protein LOC126176345 [Schistocerca cancellata]|uniref:uncharacterized protein LOC126176345 n=1 Tax=Schistocerca cancellata TaxID=274614 RepID=UPI002119630A|nr:uncharacterized protein LOC126176345 [Schistocerca cancellata]
MEEYKAAAVHNIINENTKFEDIIEELGSDGKFQLQMNIIFNFIAILFSTMSSYAKIIALTVPEHWCHVPGRESTNLTVEMWKNLTIPKSTAAFVTFTLLFSNNCFGENPFVAFIGHGSLQLAASYAAHVVGNRFGSTLNEVDRNYTFSCATLLL